MLCSPRCLKDQDRPILSKSVTDIHGRIKLSLGAGINTRLAGLKGWTAYLFSVVALSLVNKWTVRSVAHSLQDRGLAGICTSYNEDSELDLWQSKDHICWNLEAKVAD